MDGVSTILEFDRLARSLNQELRKTGAQTPTLPPKRIFGSMNDVLKQRMKGLEMWIQQILAMFGDKASFFENLRSFLTKGANCPPGVLSWSTENARFPIML